MAGNVQDRREIEIFTLPKSIFYNMTYLLSYTRKEKEKLAGKRAQRAGNSIFLHYNNYSISKHILKLKPSENVSNWREALTLNTWEFIS